MTRQFFFMIHIKLKRILYKAFDSSNKCTSKYIHGNISPEEITIQFFFKIP